MKGGEDLRLDERIQQLWRLLTGLAGRHPAAAKRGLATALTTFDVIPMTPTLGVMAFVQVGVAAGACRVSTRLLQVVGDWLQAISTSLPGL